MGYSPSVGGNNSSKNPQNRFSVNPQDNQDALAVATTEKSALDNFGKHPSKKNEILSSLRNIDNECH